MAGSIGMYRGDDHGVALTIQENGSVVDIGSWTMFFTVKDNFNEADSAAEIQTIYTVGSTVNSASGITTIPITAGETSGLTPQTYVYDIQVLTTAGSTYTLLQGDFILNSDVTRSGA